MKLRGVLEKPILTEKSVSLTDTGKYTFMVNRKAGKAAVAKDISSEFGVEVVDVKILIVPGKTRRVRGNANRFTKTAGWKKAVVTLKPGQKIDIFTKLLGEKK